MNSSQESNILQGWRHNRERKNENPPPCFGRDRRSYCERCVRSSGALDHRTGQDLDTGAMGQSQDRIRQRQAEMGLLSPPKQGYEAEGQGQLVVSLRLHEGLTVTLATCGERCRGSRSYR